jgi:hypothetical protein
MRGTCSFTTSVVLVAVVAGGGSLCPADEVDQILDRLKPPARFQNHRPEFSVEKRDFTFDYLDGPRERPMFVVKDGKRHVALIPLAGGTIHLLAFDPAKAPAELVVPRTRWRIETSPGAKLRTDAFIPSRPDSEDASYEFTPGGAALRLVRRFKGTASFDTWTHRSGGPIRLDVTNTFVFRCDPVLGYVVEGTFDSRVAPAPKSFEYFSAAAEDICNVWAGPDAPQRTVITPTYREGFEGYAMNFPSIDWSDNDRAKFRCRDGGFAAFLNRRTGWSPATTLVGAEARLVVCNAHGDLDFVAEWPDDERPGRDGLVRRVVRTRLLALPPEVTRHLWDTMSLRFADRSWVQMRVGRVEDFEDQPLPLTQPVFGLISTGGGPRLSEEHARSGRKSAVIEGRFWPNLPQVPLEPGVRYRLEAWMKVVPWSADRRAEEERKQRERFEKLRAQGRDAEPFTALGAPEAYITGHLYVSTPHANEWIVRQQTNAARPGGPEWQKVELEFTAPDWAPFINLVFVANACTAYMDDFCLKPLD